MRMAQVIPREKLLDAVVAGSAAVVLLLSALIRLSYTPVDVDVRSTAVELTLVPMGQGLSFPGEKGEIVQLNEVEASGFDQIEQSLPSTNQSGSESARHSVLYLKAEEPQIVPKPTGGNIGPIRHAIHLQEIATAGSGPIQIKIGIAYGRKASGVRIALSGSDRVTAQLSQDVVLAGGAPGLNYVGLTGQELVVSLFPAENTLTLLREMEVSSISFDEEKASGLLSGNVVVKNRGNGSFKVQTGDRLTLASEHNMPMLLRELSFGEGRLSLKLSADAATAIELGGNGPKNLMPTYFDFVRANWPARMYAALSAFIALWLALRKWWAPQSAKAVDGKP